MEGGYESGERSRRREHREYEENEENRRREAEEIFERAMEELERKEEAERIFNEAMDELRREEAEEIFNEAMHELEKEEEDLRRKEAEDVAKEALEDLERYERAQAETTRYSEDWSEIVEEKLKEIEKQEELEKEKRWAELFRQETEADEVADDGENWHNWPTPKREYEVWIGDVTGEGKSHETEEADETVKSAVKELDNSVGDAETTDEQDEGQEHTGVERPRGWDPTTDDWDDYEKDIAKGFEVTGATEEEMKERWRERYVEEMKNIIEKKLQTEKSSPDSVEGKESTKEGESSVGDRQSDEYVEYGDGTASKMVMEQPSKDTLEQDEPNPETHSEEETRDSPNDKTESSEPAPEESDAEEKSKDSSEESDSDKKEYDSYTERPTHHRRETDSYSEEENTEPSEKFREKYESRSQPTQFSENDRAPEPMSRVIDQVGKYTEYQKTPSTIDGQVESFPEPSVGKVERSDELKQKTSKQEVYEDSREDMPFKESEHEYSSEQSIDSEEKSTQQDEGNDESEAVDETGQYLEERTDEDEKEDVKESSYEHELYRDESKDVTSEGYEDESETGPELSFEYSESQQEEIEDVIESVIEQQAVDEFIDEDECTENEEYSSEVRKVEGKGSEFIKSREEIDSVEIPQNVEEHHQELKTEQTIESTTERNQQNVNHIDKNLEDKCLMYPEVSEIETSRETYESEVFESLSSKPLNRETENIEETCKPVAGEVVKETEGEELEVYENPTNEKEFGVKSYETPTETDTESQGATETLDNPFRGTQLEVQLPNQTYEDQLKIESVETETNERLLSVVRRLMKEKKLLVSFNEFETLFDRNSNLRKSKNYEKKYYQAKTFYQIVDDLSEEDYSHFSTRAVWKMMSEKYNIPASTIKPWFTGRALPQLITEVVRAERKRDGLEDSYHKKRGESIITLQIPKSTTEFICLLARHPHLREREDFDRLYKDVLTYFIVKEIIDNDPNTNISELARQLNYPRGNIQNWVRDKSRPKLIPVLLMNEQLRIKYDSELNQETHNHRIDPTLV